MNAVASSERAGLREIEVLLKDLGIKSVIFVDDDFDLAAENSALANLITDYELLKPHLAAYATEHPDLASYVDVLVDGELRDDSVVIALLRQKGKRIPTELMAELTALTVVQNDDSTSEQENDALVVSRLKRTLPSGVEYHPVKVADWPAKQKELLPLGHEPALVFLDRNLGSFGGKYGGEKLLKELMMSHPASTSTYFGLFTRDAESPEQEVSIAAPLVRRHKQAVSVMGKYRIGSADLFAEGLRIFLYSSDLHTVRLHTMKALDFALKHAKAQLTSMDFYSLMTSSMAAYKEGLLESDGPLRIVRSEIRRALDTQVRLSPPTAANARIRNALKGGNKVGLVPASPLAELEWNEKFDSLAHLANNHLALEPGDLFELAFENGDVKPYILLVQACDLMVRPFGKRSNASASFSLALVKEAPETGKPAGQKYFSIGRWKPDSETEWVVDMTQKISVSPELLDACVLSVDGKSVLSSARKAPSGLTQGWEKRAALLEGWRGKTAAKAKVLVGRLPADFAGPDRDAVQGALVAPLLGPGFGGGGLTGTIDLTTGDIEAGIARVAHLVSDRSRALLLLASQHQARPDQEGAPFVEPEILPIPAATIDQ